MRSAARRVVALGTTVWIVPTTSSTVCLVVADAGGHGATCNSSAVLASRGAIPLAVRGATVMLVADGFTAARGGGRVYPVRDNTLVIPEGHGATVTLTGPAGHRTVSLQ
ncbi:MAG: hypothetical protein ACK5RL_12015 [Acidimicrobiales bacterium]